MTKQLLNIGDYVNGLNDNACVQCGRKTGKNPLWVHVSTSGQILDREDEIADSQGCWPIGSECAKGFASGVLFKMEIQ